MRPRIVNVWDQPLNGPRINRQQGILPELPNGVDRRDSGSDRRAPWRERFDDPALCYGIVPASIDEIPQFTSKGDQICDFALNIGQVVSRYCVYCFARPFLLVRQVEEFSHPFKRKAQFTRSANEA